MKTDEFSIINKNPSEHQLEQEELTSEYQEKQEAPISGRSNFPQVPLTTIYQDLEKSEYESQIVQSLQESYPGSEMKALKQQTENKPMTLNIMVAGQSGLGKSTFIDVLLKKKLKQMDNVIRDSTLQIQEIEGSIEYEQLILTLKFIDTPGYRRTFSLRAWIKLLTNYIKEQNKSFQKRHEASLKSKSCFQKLSKSNIDERVHVCFYFFQGPRIQSEDLQTLKKLTPLINVIPILAKGDSYTIQEIQRIKMHFQEQILEYRIDLFKGEQNQKSNFGEVPPYVIITSVQQFNINGKMIYGREFPWGICDIFNPQHSDLHILYKQLVGTFFGDLTRLTDYFHNNYLKNIEDKKKKQTRSIWQFICDYFNY